MLEHASDAEISDFDLATLCHENILCLQVTMENLPVVNVLYGEGHLHEPVEDLVFTVANYTREIIIRGPVIEVE